MADHFEFRTSKSTAGDTIPAEDFSLAFEEIKVTYSKAALGFQSEGGAEQRSEEFNLNYEEIKVTYKRPDASATDGDVFFDDIFSF